MDNSPEKIFKEYRDGVAFKASLGKKGLYEQSRINERFFVGDQWYGANCGNDRPLVRHNVIKRIGEFKMAHLNSSKIDVNYGAEGVFNTTESKDKVRLERERLSKTVASVYAPLSCENENELILSALNSHFESTAARVKLSSVLDQALRNAYISGTGIVYTYFDNEANTGLFADKIGGTAITGDIAVQSLRVEDVYFGDPTCSDLQSQPYIIIAEKQNVETVRAEAVKNGFPEDLCYRIASETGEKITLLTKLFKAKDIYGKTKVYAVKVCEGVTVRGPWDIGIAKYPLSVFSWEKRDNLIYGDSEITFLIPNQIAINRMITASVWSAMTTGMPLMVVNGDAVSGDITNDPGQIIKVYGNSEEISSAVNFVSPPDYSAGYNDAVTLLISNTLTQCGANDAALGDVNPDNTSAIIELREAAALPLATLKNRYFAFIEDIALIWLEFFMKMYGKRSLKISDENGVWYIPFDAKRYENLVLSVSATAVEEVSKGESESLAILSSLFEKGAITAKQYISRLPKGIIPDAKKLLSELEEVKE